MTRVYVDLMALTEAADRIRYEGLLLADAAADLTGALADLRASPELSRYLPGGVQPVEGRLQEASIGYDDHGRAIRRFAAEVREADSYAANRPPLLGGYVTDGEVGGLTLPGPPVATDYGTVRAVGDGYQLQGPDGWWYDLDVPRVDTDEWTTVHRTEGLMRWPDRRGLGRRALEGFLALIGTPDAPFQAAPGSDYRHLWVGTSGHAWVDTDATNPAFSGGDPDFEPGDAIPQTPPETPGSVHYGPAGVAEGAALFAQGLATAVIDDEPYYAVVVTLSEDGDGGRRAVIQTFNLRDDGRIVEASVVGFDGGDPVLAPTPPAAREGPGDQVPRPRPPTDGPVMERANPP